MGDPILSVIIPAYNESATIVLLLEAVGAAAYPKQVIVVDDGSTDGTGSRVESWHPPPGLDIELVRHAVNRGKGAAIRTGLARARGRVILIQDADLEYDPADYPALVEPILTGRAEVVYGSRYLVGGAGRPWTLNRACVALLNLMVWVLFGRRVTDEATCYKAFDAPLLRRLDLRCERFEFCPEVTAKVFRLGIPIVEVPIRYDPRTRHEGKKIRWWDGVEAIATLLRWRLASLPPAPAAGPAAPAKAVGDPAL
jgi:dolichol-phosphate mannosyltransferase